ncbi:hypothetical protein [Methylorubrum sp. SB2]|uniref:hypothetical protein n=1 Tax=Methylorubrum subtropicum TaxID=3138812 RepID=UPI00313BB07A
MAPDSKPLFADQPLAISVSPQLIHDHLYTKEPPRPALGGAGTFVATEHGVIAVDGERIVCFEPDPASQSGWNVSTHRPRKPSAAASDAYAIVEIRAFTVHGGKDGGSAGATVLNVLCLYRARGWTEADGGGFAVAWIARQEGGDWYDVSLTAAAASLTSQVGQIEVVDAGAGNGVFVYGTTPNLLGADNAQFFLINLVDWENVPTSAWDQLVQTDAATLGVPAGQVANYAFMTIGSRNAPRRMALSWWTAEAAAIRLAADLDTASLDRTAASIAGLTASDFAVIGFPAGIDTVTPIQGDPIRFHALLGDMAGGLWRFGLEPNGGGMMLYQLNVVPAASSAAAVASGGVPASVSDVSVTRANGRTALFARSGETLWLLRDIDATVSEPFVPWRSLGNRIVAAAAPARETQTLEVFYADANASLKNQVFHLSRDGANSAWSTKRLATIKPYDPATETHDPPPEVSCIAIDVSVTHANRAVAAGSILTVESDQWVALIIGGLSYWVGPGRPSAPIPTDEGGRACIRHEATSLQFPRLTITAVKDGHAPVRCVCQGDVTDTGDQSASSVANRLSGSDPKHPTDAHALRTGGANKSKALVPDDASGGEHVAHMLNHTGAWLRKHPPGATLGATPLPTRCWHIRVEPDRPVACREIDPAEADTTGLGSVLGDLGDALQWAKHAALEVKDWTVTVTDDVIHVVLNDIRYVARTIREAGDIVDTILCSIQKAVADVEAFIKEVVAFLRMLFGWEDIVKTHKALKHMFRWGMQYPLARIDEIKDFSRNELGKLGKEVAGHIEKAKSHFGQEQHRSTTPNGHVNALASKSKVPFKGQYLAGTDYHRHLQHHRARCTYTRHLTNGHMGQTGLMGTAGLGRIDPSNLESAVRTHWAGARGRHPSSTETGTSVPPHVEALKKSFEEIGIDNIFDTAIVKLLDIVEALIVDSFKGAVHVADALLDLISDAIESVMKLIDPGPGQFNPIHIPVISYVYKKYTGDDMTILDVLCLILAVPVTILYKIVREIKVVAAAPEGVERPQNMTEVWDLFLRMFALLMKDGIPTPELDFAAWNKEEAAFFLNEGMPMIAGVLGLIGGVIGIEADTGAIVTNFLAAYKIPTVQSAMTGWLTWLFSGLSGLYTMPLSTWMDFDRKGAGDITQTIYWCVQFLPLMSDFIAMLPVECKLMREAYLWGPVLEGGFGEIILGAAIAYVVTNCLDDETGSTAWDYVNAILSSVPRPFRSMMLLVQNGDVIALAAVTPIILGGDALALLGGTATQIGSAIEG